jgi:ribosomal protein L7Ae-like RNA K-turn-binding protein
MPVDSIRLMSLLGLANRSGRLALGFSAVENSVRKGERPILVVATDIGDAQKRKVMNLQPVRDIITDVFDRQDLGKAMGRNELAVVGVVDRNIIQGILDLLKN